MPSRRKQTLRPPVQPIGSVRMRMDYLLYLEMFAYGCLLMGLFELALVPWAMRDRMAERASRLYPDTHKSVNITQLHLKLKNHRQHTKYHTVGDADPTTDPCGIKRIPNNREHHNTPLQCCAKTRNCYNKFEYKTLKTQHLPKNGMRVLTADLAHLFRLECCRDQKPGNHGCHCDYTRNNKTSNLCYADVDIDWRVGVTLANLTEAALLAPKRRVCPLGRVASYSSKTWKDAVSFVKSGRLVVLIGLRYECSKTTKEPTFYALAVDRVDCHVEKKSLDVAVDDCTDTMMKMGAVGLAYLDGAARLRLLSNETDAQTQTKMKLLCESPALSDDVWWWRGQ